MKTLVTADKSPAISLRIGADTKQALQYLAEREQRSVHYMAVQILSKAVQEQLDYQKSLEQQLMQASDELHKNGSKGVSAVEAHRHAVEHAKRVR
ncbi:MAG: hypothetical protein Q4G13_03685 [Moraxella sp.]|nr:hypothetical protein [Moraxella sp.]